MIDCKKKLVNVLSQWWVILGLLVTVPPSLLVLISLVSCNGATYTHYFLTNEQRSQLTKLHDSEARAALYSFNEKFNSDKQLQGSADFYGRLVQLDLVREQVSQIFRIGALVTLVAKLMDFAAKRFNLRLAKLTTKSINRAMAYMGDGSKSPLSRIGM